MAWRGLTKFLISDIVDNGIIKERAIVASQNQENLIEHTPS